MRSAINACILVLAGAFPATAEKGQIAAPVSGVANYDPTMSAKEAVLANWELAAAGIQAGQVLSGKVVGLAETGASHAALSRQAQFAQKTMVQRFNAAQWVYTDGSGIHNAADASALADAVAAAFAPCASQDCAAEAANIEATFARATQELERAAQEARDGLKARETRPDTQLMSEQLTLMADYLDGGAWASDFTLTDFGRDGEEVAARIVGTMSLWRNIEPYVGLANPEIDRDINAAAQQLLRTLRQQTRAPGALSPDGPEIMAIRAKATVLAEQFRRAAALFVA